MKRNSSVDYLKFLFSIIIFLYHFRLGIWGGYLVVEGFFMISGYLMYRSLQKNREQVELPDSTANFVWHKYRSIFLPLFFSVISGFIVAEFILLPPMEIEKLRDIPLLLFEIFPLQIAGSKGRLTTGVSWYISAMLLAMAILHPFFKKKPEHMAYSFCPITSLLIWGLLMANYGNLGSIVSWELGVFSSGLLRAVAGICAGFFLGALLQRAKEWTPTLGTKIALSVVEVLGILALIRIVSREDLAMGPYDLLVVALQFGILLVALSGKAWHTPYLSWKHSKVLSEISLYLFLNHAPWCFFYRKQYSTMGEALRLFPKVLFCTVISATAVWCAVTLTRFLLKKFSQRRSSAQGL